MSRYRLYIRMYNPSAPPTLWKGAFQYDGHGIELDCRDLPSDIMRAVMSGLSKDSHWGGCQMADGRYVTYSGKAA